MAGPWDTCKAAGMEETPDPLQPHRQHCRLSWIMQKSPCCSPQAPGAHCSNFSSPTHPLCFSCLPARLPQGARALCYRYRAAESMKCWSDQIPGLLLFLNSPHVALYWSVFPLPCHPGLALKPRTWATQGCQGSKTSPGAKSRPDGNPFWIRIRSHLPEHISEVCLAKSLVHSRVEEQ